MKKLVFLSLVMSSVISLNAQLFQQDFSSSTTVADYWSKTPNAGQFDSISPDVASAVTKSINDGALRFERTATSSIFIYRNFTLSNNPTFVQFKLDFEASNNIVGGQTPIFSVYLGSGFSFASTGVNSNYASRFGILAQATPGNFKIGTVDNIGGAPQSAEFTGKQTITYIVNNSGSDRTYTAPDASEEPVANGKMDVWIGTTRGINDFSLKNTDAVKGLISGFKIQGTSQSGTGIYDFDNFEITDLLNATATPTVKSQNNISVFPNPTIDVTEIRNLPFSIETVKLDLYNISSQLIESKTYSVSNGVVKLDMSDKLQGAYLIKGVAEAPFTLKLIKK